MIPRFFLTLLEPSLGLLTGPTRNGVAANFRRRLDGQAELEDMQDIRHGDRTNALRRHRAYREAAGITLLPTPRRVSTRPKDVEWEMASRTTIRLTPKALHSLLSGGSFWPTSIFTLGDRGLGLTRNAQGQAALARRDPGEAQHHKSISQMIRPVATRPAISGQ